MRPQPRTCGYVSPTTGETHGERTAEGCVRSAVGAQHVTSGAPGELRHLVR